MEIFFVCVFFPWEIPITRNAQNGLGMFVWRHTPTINNRREVSRTQLNIGPGLQVYPTISPYDSGWFTHPKKNLSKCAAKIFFTSETGNLWALSAASGALGQASEQNLPFVLTSIISSGVNLGVVSRCCFFGKKFAPNHPWMQMDQMVWEWVEKVTGTHRASQGLWSTKVFFFLLVF